MKLSQTAQSRGGQKCADVQTPKPKIHWYKTHIEIETRFARIFRNASFARNDVVPNKNKINCFFVYEIKYKQLLAKADYGPVESKRGGRGGPLDGFI